MPNSDLAGNELYFRLGYNPVRCYEDHDYVGEQDGASSLWAPVSEPDVRVRRLLKGFDADAMRTLIELGWRNVGRIILRTSSWGLLLDLRTVESVYEGRLPDAWARLLACPLVVDLFRRFAYYIQDENDDYAIDIPTTEDDAPIERGRVPFFDRLTIAQQHEVGFMASLEANPVVRVGKASDRIPFLDTGHVFDAALAAMGVADGLLCRAEDAIRYKDVPCPGGVLASETGSGKTVSVIALISTRVPPRERQPKRSVVRDSHAGAIPACGPTLVVVTENILYQWADEFRRFAPDLRVLVVESMEEWSRVATEALSVDVVLTHRGVLVLAGMAAACLLEDEDDGGSNGAQNGHPERYELPAEAASELRAAADSLRVHWARLINDEFHEVMTDSVHKLSIPQFRARCADGPSSSGGILDGVHSRACRHLKGFGLSHSWSRLVVSKLSFDFAWGVTGTPGELAFASMLWHTLSHLGVPHSEKWTERRTMRDAFLRRCIRRNPRPSLPPVYGHTREVEFTSAQRMAYRLMHGIDENTARELCSHLSDDWRVYGDRSSVDTVLRHISARQDRAIATVKSELSSIFGRDPTDAELAAYPSSSRVGALVSRLETLQSADNIFASVSSLVAASSFECPVCLSGFETESALVVSGCLHTMCCECFADILAKVTEAPCPLCRQPMTVEATYMHPRNTRNTQTKADAIVAFLLALSRDRQGEKIILYTQFQDLAKHLGNVLSSAGIVHVRLRGDPSERNLSVRRFKEDALVAVLLMSVEQSASGINVTEANHVVFAHPIFGMARDTAAATYRQCVGRAHRFGQQRPVHVTVFVTAHSLEAELFASHMVTFDSAGTGA